ncbi:MAG: phenylalanine--tRNA ligase subunit beta, partial [Leptospiraceae bacterium]|nr:phenylalanine--tRNA ligase subunit beta [Leptospiraceae bacterium]
MKLSLNWINEFVELKGISTEQLVKSLTLATCEVEDVLKPFGDLESLLVARIESFEKHPDADRLNICKVFDGKNTLQVICGAPNVRAGIHVMLAPVGATIGEGLHIEKRKIRGVESSGMICAPAEVGLELLFPEREGILILDDESLQLKEGLRTPEKFIGKSVAA